MVTLADGVSISWNNISNKPSIPSKTSDLTNNSDYQDAGQVREIANSAVKSTKDELDALKKNIGYTQIGSDYVVSPKIVGAYGEFTKAFSGICLISILYQDFSLTIVTMFYFESALIYEILLASMWGFLLKSVIGSYVSNFAFWIIAMIASIANHKLSFLARYDASNPIFLRFNQYYNTGNTEYLDIIGNVIYTIILSGVILGIVCAFRKRWEKNGI